MKLRRSQNGLTMISWMFVMSAVGFFVYIGIILFPVYINHNSIYSVMKSFEIEPDTKKKTARQLKKIVQRRLKVNSVYDFSKDNIRFSKSGGMLNLDMSYVVKKPLFANISIVIDFDLKTKMPLR